ncbi:MAG TPA: ECF-type sigma factor [Balneolaceae bacterium]|nr:ECF-type sigma factor [Balneolaceae bacterium]
MNDGVALKQIEVTHILKKANSGSKKAYDKLLPLIYDKLLDIAQMRMEKEYGEHTYCRTELVHEAYFQLINIENVNWQDRSHFYAVASKCMRQILIDYARKKKAEKRGGDERYVTYVEEVMKIDQQAEDLIDLDNALKKLAAISERMAEVVECRYFGEMTIDDTAAALDISPSTVKREWAKARGWLYKELKKEKK